MLFYGYICYILHSSHKTVHFLLYNSRINSKEKDAKNLLPTENSFIKSLGGRLIKYR